MPNEIAALRVMVFLSEDDRAEHRSLPEVLVERAREEGMAGATLWRGIEGFGATGHLRGTRFPDVDLGLPLVLEVVDAPERIEEFLVVVHELAPGSFVTTEEVTIVGGGAPGALPLDDAVPPPDRRR